MYLKVELLFSTFDMTTIVLPFKIWRIGINTSPMSILLGTYIKNESLRKDLLKLHVFINDSADK